MFVSGDLYWHEGLFIQPHHFQKFQRGIEEQFQHEHSRSRCHSYGITSFDINTVKIKEGYLEFNELSAYMPSGTYVDINTNAVLSGVSLKDYEGVLGDSFLVYLGIPIWSNKRPNTAIEDSKWQKDRLYNVEELNWNDEDNCENPMPILTRKIKLHLFFENENRDGYETIPLMKVEKQILPDGQEVSKVSKNFIPPCYFISASAELLRIFSDIIYKIRTAAKELDKMIKDSEFFNDAPERLVKAFLRLSSLNSNGIFLSKIISQKNITPFDVYLKLVSLAGELAIIVPEFDLFAQVPDYNHEDLFVCLQKLKGAIEKLLSYPAYIQLYRKEKFLSINKNLYEVDISTIASTNINEYYIGVFTHRPSTDIINIMEKGDSFKVLPPSLSKGKAIPGIKLEHQHVLPNGFPKFIGLYYFRLNAPSKDDLIWNKVIKEKKIYVSLTDEVSELIKSIDLYIQKSGE